MVYPQPPAPITALTPTASIASTAPYTSAASTIASITPSTSATSTIASITPSNLIQTIRSVAAVDLKGNLRHLT